ncbi:hypothetical protein M0813_08292 [Anaeramoeba flamelloides]|uniref:Uncharacterized protein n=1 Tax=Anaeramoeba flamelloides TaxID=1746091 RepID=A0ABQ8X9W4_9EUKA|nr:hypothetical protein M0813_08292 [Anaeramoeba flamelloides]
MCGCSNFCENRIGYSKINLRTLYAPVWSKTKTSLNIICFLRFLIFGFVLLAFIMGLYQSYDEGKFWIYLTYQTTLLQLLLSALVFFRSIYLLDRIHDPVLGAEQPARALDKFIWTLYQTVFPMPHVVALIYWPMIYDPDTVMVTSYLNHGPLLIQVYFELICSETPFHWGLLPISLVYYLLYLAAHLIYVFVADDPVYESVDPHNSEDIFWFPMIIVFFVLFFAFGKLIRYLTTKCCPHEKTIKDRKKFVHSTDDSSSEEDIELNSSPKEESTINISSETNNNFSDNLDKSNKLDSSDNSEKSDKSDSSDNSSNSSNSSNSKGEKKWDSVEDSVNESNSDL